MRAAPAAVKTFLASNRAFWRADLITLTLRDGTTTYRWTSWDQPLTVSAVTYQPYAETGTPGGPVLSRGAYRQSREPVVDTLDLTLAGPRYTIGGLTLTQQALAGFFDGSRLRLDHLIMPSPGDVSLGSIPSRFEGRLAGVDPRGPTVVLRCKSELEALNQFLPRFLVGPSCGNAIYDTNCGLVKASFTLAGTVSGSPTTSVFTTSTAAIQAKATGYYNLGVLAFTSGVNNGSRRAVRAFTTGTGQITLALPLPAAPSAGDTFTIYPGCDRSRGSCSGFSNLVHWRGYPHVPAPEGGGF